MSSVDTSLPVARVRPLNDAPIRSSGRFVLYWMVATRRSTWNHALDRAVELARALDRPLLVLEALRIGYPWASERMHHFVLDGMADNQRAFEGAGLAYYPYVEPHAGAGSGLLETMAAEACAVVTDDYPTFFLPRMALATGAKLDVQLEAVDSCGLVPLRAPGRAFLRAVDFRRYLQRHLREHLGSPPRRSILAKRGEGLRPLGSLPQGIEARWPRAQPGWLEGQDGVLRDLPLDHGVRRTAERGGARSAGLALERFLDTRLERYGDGRNQPESDAASGLSPWLHFGHLSTHDILVRIAEREGWAPDDVERTASGKRSGWWGMGEASEAFLDQVVTWRELGYGFCAWRPDHEDYASLPDWARRTLAEHAVDPRPHRYSLATFEAAETHDPLWNAAQNQLREEGRMHNYLRMLWGKKVLHWSEGPEAALEILVELNNKYALDGRDPNSSSGIFWTLGRFDRAWGPERPVFGKVRYMSSANTHRKLRVKGYIERWAPPGARATQTELF